MTQQQIDYGAHWRDQERVQQYVSRTDQREAERAGIFQLVADLAPFAPGARVRVLDIGSGHAPFAAAMLDAFPNAEAVGLDLSDAMMDLGRERMGRFGDRFSYQVGDFGQGALPAGLTGSFSLAVASASIHHLPSDSKRRLYQAVFDKLQAPAAFFNLDTMMTEDAYIQERFKAVAASERERQKRPPGGATGHAEAFGHFYEPVETHLGWLKDIGFTPVHCFYHRLSRALICGYKL